MPNPLGARAVLNLPDGKTTYYRLQSVSEEGITPVGRLPFSIRVLLENVLRHAGRGAVTEQHVVNVAEWSRRPKQGVEVPFMPGRVVLQDFTGVPAVVDLAAMRDAMVALGGPPERISPLVPTDLVIDHSVQVDHHGSPDAFAKNVDKELVRNRERYALLRWAQEAFAGFRVVPTGTGIVHQVNLEYLASVVRAEVVDGERIIFPDTLVGTDSHTTMINGIGVLGWGVGGIEAEAVMLGQPYFMSLPEVVGVKLTGQVPPGVTATDVVLTVVQVLRTVGVVGRFVEYFGPGLQSLSLADRATLANMAPEYGATTGFFPVDEATVEYLRQTGRPAELVERVERYCKAQQLWFSADDPEPEYTAVVTVDLSAVVPSLAGPRRPQDRVPLRDIKPAFAAVIDELRPPPVAAVGEGAAAAGADADLSDGDVVIAAITSCTNTSNPSVMIGAGLVARAAVAKGLRSKPWVKTSLAPGSKVVTDYLVRAELLGDLEALGFHVVGYGCTTCIGNSGPLPEPVAQAIRERRLVVASVLSGNRNFEARIHALVRANYLASPMLVVAYALAGRLDIDFEAEPLGHTEDGAAVFLKDLWPSPAAIAEVLGDALHSEMYEQQYATVFEGDERWRGLPVARAEEGRFGWQAESTYVAPPPFLDALAAQPAPVTNIAGAQVLAVLGDTVTTDHISPAGAIPVDGPAGRWLIEQGVEPTDFNTFGSRRGHHEVMMRGTFGNTRIRNALAEGKEGNWTEHLPSGEITSIYDAAMRYAAEQTPLVVLAGKEYGTGSSRDWAAKGTALLGVRAVLAQSFERIHRGNLIGMGVLPLQFADGQGVATLALTGRERFDITGIDESSLRARGRAQVRVQPAEGPPVEFEVILRLDTAVEVDYYRHGGILPYVLRQLARL